MATTAFTGTGKIERKYLACCVNTGTYELPVWELLGLGVEDSSIEMNFEEETVTDITGVTTSTISKPVRQQSFEPVTLKSTATANFQTKIYDIMRNDDWGKLTEFDLLIVFRYVEHSSGTGFDAERYPASGINVESLGGDSVVNMPFTATYGGNKELGKAVLENGAYTFTKDTTPAEPEE